MDEEKYKEISKVAVEINSLSYILSGYCENYMESSEEMSHLYELAQILQSFSNKLFNLL